MNMNVRSKFNLRSKSSKTSFFVSLMSLLLLASLFPYTMVVGVAAAVETETELTAAIEEASLGVSVVITLGKDITLTNSLNIPAGKNITLASTADNEFKLIGAADKSVLIVDTGGILVLNGIIVTHPTNVKGSGVNVTAGGALTLVNGNIFNNTDLEGGGVVNYGNFTMTGGKISNISSTEFVNDAGGAILNRGNFTLTGGEISGNNILCGVFNFGNFTMTNGKILKNIGNGIINTGNLTMTGGEISNNKADNGGGVYISSTFGIGNFTMTGGMIFNNSAIDNGGGVYNNGGTFNMSNGIIANNTAIYGGGIFSTGNVTMSNGEVSNNTATAYGGGVYNYNGNFTLTNGALFNNTAVQIGGGIYTYGGNFTMTGGKISSNTARNGGGVGVSSLGGLEYVYIRDNAIFSNNRASTSYTRSTSHDELYNSRIGRSVTWTSPFTQGYNNYDILYTWGTIDGDTSPSPTSSTKPTDSPTNTPGNTSTPSSTPIVDPPGRTNIWRIVIVLALVVGLVVAVLVFYLPRRAGTKPAEEDLSNFTIV
jgi:hypothetical protein